MQTIHRHNECTQAKICQQIPYIFVPSHLLFLVLMQKWIILLEQNCIHDIMAFSLYTAKFYNTLTKKQSRL